MSSSSGFRLRQIALVAKDFNKAKEELSTELGTFLTYVDPEIDFFGLQNGLFPVANDCFLEIVSPIENDVTAQRYLDKHGGQHAGYMLLLQITPVQHAKDVFQRVQELGLKVIHQGSKTNGDFVPHPFEPEGNSVGFARPGIAGIHLHPKQVGCITEITSSVPPEEWAWAGDKWHKDPNIIKQRKNMPTVNGFAFAEIGCREPKEIATTWSNLLRLPSKKINDAAYEIEVDPGHSTPCVLRFVKSLSTEDDTGLGVTAIGIYTKEKQRVTKRLLGVDFHMIPVGVETASSSARL